VCTRYEGWTRQQAIDYSLANTPQAKQDVTVEVDRYTVWPGQPLGDKMGPLGIREWRTNPEKDLGAHRSRPARHFLPRYSDV
jgi:uncharacterized protein (DUF885 family)